MNSTLPDPGNLGHSSPLPEEYRCSRSACIVWAGVRLPGIQRAEATNISQWKEPSCPKCQELLTEKFFSPEKFRKDN